MSEAAKVLIVEDDIELCNGWRDLFNLLGHDLTCYHKAADILADQNKVKSSDFIISDYYLPDINGVELLKKLRALNSKAPFVLLTGSREHAIIESLKEMPNCSLLQKPINIDEIETHLNRVVSEKTAANKH